MQIDKVKTASNVKNFLKYEYDTYVHIVSANPAYIQSPKLGDVVVSGGASNGISEKYDKYLHAKEIVEGVQNSLRDGSLEMELTVRKIIEHYPLWKITNQIHVSKSHFYYLEKNYLCEFADIFEMYPGCPDLHIYK